jgi:hypothetical protein
VISLVIAEAVIHLRFQCCLQHSLCQSSQQAPRADQTQPVTTGLLDHLLGDLLLLLTPIHISNHDGHSPHLPTRTHPGRTDQNPPIMKHSLI